MGRELSKREPAGLLQRKPICLFMDSSSSARESCQGHSPDLLIAVALLGICPVEGCLDVKVDLMSGSGRGRTSNGR